MLFFIKIFYLFWYSLVYQTLRWAEESGKLVMYDDPFVVKHKNNYKLLRKIHYQVKAKHRDSNTLKYIDNVYTDWRSEIVNWYNKWVTEGYSTLRKHLFVYGDSYADFKEFIKQIMGNYFMFLKNIFYLLKY